MDLNNDGTITMNELKAALMLHYDDMKLMRGQSTMHTQKIIQEIDYLGNGQINYTEFLAAALALDKELNEEQLWHLFKKFSIDDTNVITKANLNEAFTRLGRTNIKPEEIDEMIRTHAKGDQEEISFEDFAAIFGQFDGLEIVKQDTD